jgi:hypothetical protein
MSEVRKDSEDVFAGIGILTNKVLNKFSFNSWNEPVRDM